MIDEYIVEGVNFVTVVPVDAELHTDPYMEAATITVEHAFRPTKPPEGFKILTKRHVSPGIGTKLFVWKNGEIGNDKEMHTFNFVDVARNAGMLELVKFIEKQN